MTETSPTALGHVAGLVCVVCDKTYPAEEAGYVCPDHGNEGILDVRYDYERIGMSLTRASLARNPDRTMWRYRPLMPIADDAEVPPLTVGGTPMYDAPRLAADLGVRQVWVKDEGRQPTASLKDRASAMAIVARPAPRSSPRRVPATRQRRSAASARRLASATSSSYRPLHRKQRSRSYSRTDRPSRSSTAPTPTRSSCAWRLRSTTGGTTATPDTTRT